MRMVPKFIHHFVFSLTVILHQTLPAADWQDLYHSGEQKLSRGKAAEASRDFQKCLAEAESANAGPVALTGILDAFGRSRFREGKYREAAGYFEKALELADSPSNRMPGLFNLANTYRELGETAKAEARVREAFAIAPNDARVWRLLGSILIRSRKYEEAGIAERKALDLGNPSVAALAWSDLSVMEEARGRYPQAAGYLEKAIALLPAGHERGRLLVNLAMLETKARRPDAAATHLREAIREFETALGSAHPDLATALDSYAEVLRSAGRKPQAREAAERARQIRTSLSASVDWRDLR